MSLNIVSVLPADGATGVILQGAVIVTFDAEIDTTTFSEQSFLLSAPPVEGTLLTGGELRTVSPVSGTDYVQGSFSFAENNAGATVATFTPSRPLRPNVPYTVLISTEVQALDGTPLEGTCVSKFTTGVLNLRRPPAQCPLPSQAGRIKPSDLAVTPSSTAGNDLHQIIITLPDDVDPSSFNVTDIGIDIEAFLQDPGVAVPAIVNKTVSVFGRTITITLAFGADGAQLLTPPSTTPISMEASIAISAFRAVSSINGEVEYADPATLVPAIGISVAAAQSGASVAVQSTGEISFDCWSWVPNIPVFVGAAGVLTQTAPATGFVQIIGLPISSNALLLDLQPPIYL